MTNFDRAIFIEKSKQLCLQSFWAYFVENDMDKSSSAMPADRFKSFCVSTLTKHVHYTDFMDYLLPTKEYEHNALVEDVQLHIPFATDELCIVFLTAKLFFLIDNGYKIQFNVRISYVVVQKQGQLEILHLHFSMPHKNIRTMYLQAQDEDSTIYINAPSEQKTEGAATAAGMYSPNGLIFYQISGKEQINLVNDSLLKLLGYKCNKDLLAHTEGCLAKLVLQQDWPHIQQKLQQRQQGKVFNLNVSFLHKDGTPIKVLLRGNYVETHNQFFILSLTPLLLPQEQLPSCNTALIKPNPEDYSIPYELFLKIALDIFTQYGREKGIPQLLELATTVLNAHSGWLCDVLDLNAPLKLFCNYTVPGYKKLTPLNLPGRCVLQLCHKYSTFAYNSPQEMPHPIQDLCQQQGITSFMCSIISVAEQESFMLFFQRQEKAKPWTTNEKKIMHYTSKMFALLLNRYFQKHTLRGDGGAP